jgi:hypothetical protein
MASHHKAELKVEQAKLDGMLFDLESLQVRIAKQKRVIAALTELADASEASDPPTGLVSGITDAVRTVFWSAEKTDKPFTPTEIANRVKALGVPPQMNMLASVHTIVRRLRKNGEIEPTLDGGYIRKNLLPPENIRSKQMEYWKSKSK